MSESHYVLDYKSILLTFSLLSDQVTSRPEVFVPAALFALKAPP